MEKVDGFLMVQVGHFQVHVMFMLYQLLTNSEPNYHGPCSKQHSKLKLVHNIIFKCSPEVVLHVIAVLLACSDRLSRWTSEQQHECRALISGVNVLHWSQREARERSAASVSGDIIWPAERLFWIFLSLWVPPLLFFTILMFKLNRVISALLTSLNIIVTLLLNMSPCYGLLKQIVTPCLFLFL